MLARMAAIIVKFWPKHEPSLWFYFQFVRMHSSLRMSPAMAAGLTDTLHDMGWLADMIEAARLTCRVWRSQIGQNRITH